MLRSQPTSRRVSDRNFAFARPVHVYPSRIFQTYPPQVIIHNQINYFVSPPSGYTQEDTNYIPGTSTKERFAREIEERITALERKVDEIAQRKYLSDEQWKQVIEMRNEMKSLMSSVLELKALLKK